jgi:hypothetical protein
MAGGFSRGIAPLTIDKNICLAPAIVHPSNEDVAGTVSLGPIRFLRAIFLPTFAHLPIGMTRKFEGPHGRILKSVKALTPSSSSTSPLLLSVRSFLVLDVLLIGSWRRRLMQSSCYSCLSFPRRCRSSFLVCYWCCPDSILCTTFALLCWICYLYAWRLLVDRILSSMVTILVSCVSSRTRWFVSTSDCLPRRCFLR